MAKKTVPSSNSSKPKSPPRKPALKTDADKIRALEEQLAQRDAELAVINSIQTALASNLDFQGVIDIVGDKLNEIFTDGNVGIGFLDKTRNVTTFPYVIENGKRLDYFEISMDQPNLMSHIMKRRRPVLINSKFKERFGGDKTINFPGRDQRDLKSWLSVPFFKGNEVIGAMSLRSWDRENAFTGSDVRLLQTIANSMIVALENARLLKETEQRATELQIINNIGQTLSEGLDLNTTLERVGERMRDVLNLNHIGIIVLDPKTGNEMSRYFHSTYAYDYISFDKFKIRMRLSARGGGRSWVVNTNAEKSWRKFGEDIEAPKSFVALPLLAGKELIGGILFADFEKENAFVDLSINMVETIASNMGTAIQNVRLFEETQRLLKETEQRATELQIINNIGQTLTEGLDLQSTVERVGERLREALKFERISIVVFDEIFERIIAIYDYRDGKPISGATWDVDGVKLALRLSARGGGRSWVVTKNVEKAVRKFGGLNEGEIPKSFVQLPLLSGGIFVGGISFVDYEREDAFTDISISMLETIASNLGTAIQNVRLFDETQRLLKETEQRATELQVINNIGQTLTEGLDLQSTLERVGDRLREALKVESIGIIANDIRTGLVISAFVYLKGKRVIPDRYSLSKNMLFMRFVERTGGKPVVINTNVEKNWRKFLADSPEWAEIPKAFVMVPLLAGGELVGSITIPDYEREDAFTDLPINMLETIASNMGTAIQNVRLFDETQRLLKETEQRAAELQIINNIGQTLTEGLDLQSTIEHVGERLREILKIHSIAIAVSDPENDFVVAQYIYHNGERVAPNQDTAENFKFAIRFAARWAGRSWVANTSEKYLEKYIRKFAVLGFPKSFAAFPLLSGGEVIGGITIADDERDDAFTNLPIEMLETISSNMGTAIQNVRLFDETQHLLKETEQRATELQIINNIGQTLTEGLDLQSTLERVGERLRETLDVKSIGIVAFDPQAGLAISNYIYHYGRRIIPQRFSMSNYKYSMRFALKVGSKPWVVNTDVERYWKKFGIVAYDAQTEWTEIPKAFVIVPMLAGRELVGSITIADYENVNAFVNLPLNLLETIASNMGTAIQNVRLFDETKRLFEEAEESRASAEQANKAKSTFLANMSHELRTPLNAIIGFTRIVKKKADGALPEKQIENLDKVLISSEHLLGLINTVLDIAKIEAGRMDVVPSKFSLSTLADQCATLATPLLKPNVTLEKQADETLGLIFSDQDKIKQIVLNLLSNAAKFTHTGKIFLSVQKLNDENVSISVTDSGIGISEAALGRIFEEFQQADTSTTREYGGTGLGLAISRNLARLLGGDLTATSELGKGSTFTLTIPIKYGRKSASSPDPKPDSTQSAESKADDGATKPNGRREALKSILIVEDTEFNIDVLTQLLNDDYHLLIARDGAQGVSMAQQESPDLILMDISLPVMDGYEATRRIRRTMKSVPIIGLSAHAMSGDAEKAKEAGCNDYMTKPVDEVLLIQKLNQYLR